MLNVYQIVLTSSVINGVNRLRDRAQAEAEFPQYEASSRLMCFGAKKFAKEDFAHYSKVAEVATDDLEDCFTIMNRWEPEDERKVNRLDKLHSLSVGDIVEQDGKFFFCDNCGFKEISIGHRHEDMDNRCVYERRDGSVGCDYEEN